MYLSRSPAGSQPNNCKGFQDDRVPESRELAFVVVDNPLHEPYTYAMIKVVTSQENKIPPSPPPHTRAAVTASGLRSHLVTASVCMCMASGPLGL